MEAILKHNPDLSAEDIADRNGAAAVAERLGVQVDAAWGLGKIQIEIFEETAEAQLLQTDLHHAYPTEVSPLARRNDHDPFVTDRFEFFVGGAAGEWLQ